MRHNIYLLLKLPRRKNQQPKIFIMTTIFIIGSSNHFSRAMFYIVCFTLSLIIKIRLKKLSTSS
jgi:hypothetical protein